MLNKSASKRKRFYGEDYATSRERVSTLNDIIKEGEKAAIVKEYMDKILEETGQDVLRDLANGNGNPVAIQMYYKAVNDISMKVNYAVSQGIKKQEKLQEIIKKG